MLLRESAPGTLQKQLSDRVAFHDTWRQEQGRVCLFHHSGEGVSPGGGSVLAVAGRS